MRQSISLRVEIKSSDLKFAHRLRNPWIFQKRFLEDERFKLFRIQHVAVGIQVQLFGSLFTMCIF